MVSRLFKHNLSEPGIRKDSCCALWSGLLTLKAHFTKCYSYKKKLQSMYCSVHSSSDVSCSAVLVAISVVHASSISVVQFMYMLDDVGKHKMSTEC